jgi:hypothetical protein
MNAFKALIFVVDYTPFFKLAFYKAFRQEIAFEQKARRGNFLLMALSNQFKASMDYYVR